MNTVEFWTDVRWGWIVYGFLCLGVGFIARQKGRSETYCALASLLFSPLLVFLYLLAVPALPRTGNSETLFSILAGFVFLLLALAPQYFIDKELKIARAMQTMAEAEAFANDLNAQAQRLKEVAQEASALDVGVTYRTNNSIPLSRYFKETPSQTLASSGYFTVYEEIKATPFPWYKVIVNDGVHDYFMYMDSGKLGVLLPPTPVVR